MTPETPGGPNGSEIDKDLDMELREAQETLAEKNKELIGLLDGGRLLEILRRMWYRDDSNAVTRQHMGMEKPMADVILAICDTVRKNGDVALFNELSGIITEESRAERESKEKFAPTTEIDPA